MTKELLNKANEINNDIENLQDFLASIEERTRMAFCGSGTDYNVELNETNPSEIERLCDIAYFSLIRNTKAKITALEKQLAKL